MPPDVVNVEASGSPDATLADLISSHRLAQLFAPRGVAVVGASDTSTWSRNVVASLHTAGFAGPVIPVHPRIRTVLGVPTRPSLRDVEEPVDLAFVLAPPHSIEDIFDDAAAAGVRNAVVLAAGYAEQSEAGRQRQESLVAHAMARGITLLGPNCLGFVNAIAGVAPYGLTLDPPLKPGPVGLVLQSGALASGVLNMVRGHNIGLRLLVSTGNEAMVTAADVVDYLIEDDATQVIALFLEGVRKVRQFTDCADRAADAGKPLVVFKVGRSPAGQRSAYAHTGAVAGDDAVVTAALRQHGVIAVNSIEELVVTAGVLAHCQRPPAGRRMGVVTDSGGACEVVADRAHDEGIEIPSFTPKTEARLRAILPDFVSVKNPLDITGFELAGADGGVLDAALSTVAADPEVDLVFLMGVTPPTRPPGSTAPDPAKRYERLVTAIRKCPVPVFVARYACTDLADYPRDLLERAGLHMIGGMDLGLAAIGHALRWQEHRRAQAAAASEPVQRTRRPPAWTASISAGTWPEDRARELLRSYGVPLVPAELARTHEEAVAAARRQGLPVVLKVCRAGIPHKSDIGGIALGLRSANAVRRAFPRVCAAAEGAVAGPVDGVLVAPMRTGGVELLAGVTVDPMFGPVLAVGLGGVWVEVLRDVALRVLPIRRSDVIAMLTQLRGAPLLRGARGTEPVDLEVVAAAVVALTDAALALGPSLRAIEANPLWASGSRVEVLDALVVTG